jgi:hypothetical protein
MADNFGRGLIPRDYAAYPSGYMAAAPSAPDDWIIPENEWDERLKEQQANKSSLLDIRGDNYDILKSLNQGSRPLCWGFSTTKSIMYMEAMMGSPLVLSPWWIAGVSNNWKNQGGWCTLSLQGAAEIGAVTMELCPDFSPRYATPANKEVASKRRVIEWWDGSENRDRNRAIMVSAFLLGVSPVLDFNHMSHSMSGCCLLAIKPKLKIYTDNSWGAIEQYGPKGLYELDGNLAIPDGITVPRVVQPMA